MNCVYFLIYYKISIIIIKTSKNRIKNKTCKIESRKPTTKKTNNKENKMKRITLMLI